MKSRLAIVRFASCGGCQSQFFNLGEEFLVLAETLTVAFFPAARSRTRAGPYDITFVEGSITTRDDARRIVAVRAQSRWLITIGACATAGGIQALLNWADIERYKQVAYPSPELVSTLSTSTPVAEHVPVDFEIWGCPIDPRQLLAVVRALLSGARPFLPSHSVCLECKRRGNVCVAVATGEPCLGPVTRTGCGAICPQLQRGCYGCFGPADDPNMGALTWLLAAQGLGRAEAVRRLRHVNAHARRFRETSDAIRKNHR